ncbi:hypothetical protein FSP39_014659, partial [Pinctada imbricata]
IFYHYLPVPLPPQIIVFGIGDWPKVDNSSVEATISYKDDNVTVGKITKQRRAICWEQRNNKIPGSFTSAEETGLAKLAIEFSSTKSFPSGENLNNTEEESIFTSVKEGEIKEETGTPRQRNESTPRPSKCKDDEPEKPGKQKKRASIAKDEKTPTGPNPKKQKTNTRVRTLKNKLDTSLTSPAKDESSHDQDKENMVDSMSASPKLMSPKLEEKTNGLPIVARCKDVTSRAPHPSNRWGHSLCMIHNNSIILVGGQGERQQLCRDSVWSLDPVTRKWKSPELKSESKKPEYRMGHTATYDPKLRCIYVFGGSKNLQWFHDVHMLDIDELKWQLLKVAGKAPTRAYHSATLYRNELWIFGGVYPRPDPQPDGCSNDIHIFSPVMENWYQPIVKGDKPLARSGHSATLIDEKLVIFGGWDAPICYNDLHILDMCFVEWTKPTVNGTPPLPRSWHASCALSNNRILIHGGYDGNQALDDTHIFSLSTLSWMRIKLEPTPIPRAGHQAVSLPYYHENQQEDEVLIFGGGDNDGAFYHDLISASIPFNPVEETETLKPSVPVLTETYENLVST